jgi:hypothetical protein
MTTLQQRCWYDIHTSICNESFWWLYNYTKTHKWVLIFIHKKTTSKAGKVEDKLYTNVSCKDGEKWNGMFVSPLLNRACVGSVTADLNHLGRIMGIYFI